MREKYRYIKNLIVFMLIFITISSFSYSYSNAATEYEYPINIEVYINGDEAVTVRGFNYYYPGNIYVSLRDMAVALIGTTKAYDVGVKDNVITIRTGMDYIATGGENEPFAEEALATDYSLKYTLSRNKMLVDDIERKYYSIILANNAGRQDCFVSITDFAMIFDVDVRIDKEKLYINTDNRLNINPLELEAEGFFDMVNSSIVGDVTTGEIYFSTNKDMSVPMASTTKIMTYVIAMDAVKNGTISENAIITFSENVERLANTSDGVIKLKEGDSVSLKEALIGMMLPSSNEMALAIAENIAGSEDEFVKLMNDKAKAIGLSDAVVFHNCNGLPSFSNTVLNIKQQNMISAEDMFKLVKYIMEVYPEITEITSLTSYRIEPLQVTVTNTNPLLYNLDGVVGLKTGTTSRAGACLVTLMKQEKEDGIHYIVVAEFGAETPYYRGMISELLLRYAVNRNGGDTLNSNVEMDISTPEKLIQFLLN